MIFKSIYIEKWNQFEKIDIKLDPKLTVITGANGAGKSSILRILSRMIGWSFNEMATPIKSKTSTGQRFRIGRRKMTEINNQHWESIGHISLIEGNDININAPSSSHQVNYDISLHNNNYNKPLKGLNIPSHRTAYSYRQITSIPVKAHTRNEAYNMFNSSVMSRYMGSYSEPPSQQMKATIISLAIFGGGNDYVQSDPEAMNLFLGFVEILRNLLPTSLGFENLSVRGGEVILETRSGDFLLDSVSGGIGAILDLAWQIYMFDEKNGEPFFVLIDEAENHLHASMQRRLLPSLMSSFPNTQFIVTTHSPLMVNSVKDSTVYALKYNEENAVVSELLDFENKSANASQILREVLGVPVTMPIWVEETLQEILNKYRSLEMTAEIYKSLKMELSEIGLSDHLPQALGLLHEEV